MNLNMEGMMQYMEKSINQLYLVVEDDYEEDEYLPEDDTDSEDSKVPDDWFHDIKREDGD